MRFLVEQEGDICIVSSPDGLPFPETIVQKLRLLGWDMAPEGDRLTKKTILNLGLRLQLEEIFEQPEFKDFQIFARLSTDEPRSIELIAEEQTLIRALKAAQSKGLPLKLRKSCLRGKFCNELFVLITELFGDSLKISPELLRWREQAVEPGFFPPELERIAKISNIELLDYQKTAIAFLIKRPRAILAAGPGSGKTFISLLAAKYLDLPVQVICPIILEQQWREAARKFGMSLLVANPEKLPHLLKDYLWQDPNAVLILDESSLYRNRKSIRFQLAKKLASKKLVVWELSGSPILKSIDQIWSQLNLLDPVCWPSYWNFAKRYCIVTSNKWGTSIDGNLPGAEVALKRNLSDIMLAFLSEDVIPLPDWEIKIVNCKMEGEQDKIYKKALKEFAVEILGSTEDNSVEKIQENLRRRIEAKELPGRAREDGSTVLFFNSSLSKFTRLLQIASSPAIIGASPVLIRNRNVSSKWEKCISLTKQHLSKNDQGLIWFIFRTTGQLLKEQLERLEIPAAKIDGSTSRSERIKILENFNSGQVKVLLLHPAVARFGLNLQKANFAIYLERNFDQEAFFQSMYRTRRLGSFTETQVYFLLSQTAEGEKTIDHLVHKTLSFQTNMMREILTDEFLQILFPNRDS
jgi:SNF2 family DNA or RNA helicase